MLRIFRKIGSDSRCEPKGTRERTLSRNLKLVKQRLTSTLPHDRTLVVFFKIIITSNNHHFLSTMSMRQLETPLVSSGSPESGASTLVQFGSATKVPNNDICRLAYYIRCCVLGCGCENSNAPAELMDYNNAHRLPSHLQLMIYHLALSDLHPQILMNRMFFIDDSNKLLKPDMMNAFFEWSASTSRILAQLEGSSFVEQGSNAYVFRKVMVCTSTWLNEYCIRPLYRHISERLGSSIVLSRSPMPAAASEDESELNRSISLHCWHCVGSSDSCTCQHGCAPIANTECHVLHDHVVCGGCHCTDILGSRYRCTVCPNLELCKKCYHDSTVHDQTHAFEVIARLGVIPQPLRPRVQLVDECSSIFFLKEQGENVPIAIAIPILEKPRPAKKQKTAGGTTCFVEGEHAAACSLRLEHPVMQQNDPEREPSPSKKTSTTTQNGPNRKSVQYPRSTVFLSDDL